MRRLIFTALLSLASAAGAHDFWLDLPRHRAAPDRGDGGARIVLTEPGTHVIAFETMQSESDLPADESTAYAEHEGLTPVLAARRQAGTSATARGRELYSRRATVVWSQACDHPRADFDTVFASLTFGR